MSQSNIAISNTLPEELRVKTLTESNIISIASAWRKRGYEHVSVAPDGVWVGIAESRLHDTDDDVSINGPDSKISDDVIRALVEKAKGEWGGSLESRGPEEFQERLWLECQRQEVDFINYEPSDALERKYDAEVVQKLRDEQTMANARGVATDADLLIAAARGDEESFNKLRLELRAFVGSYLDDEQRAKLAKQAPLDIVTAIDSWERIGHEELEFLEDEASIYVRPQISAPRAPAPAADNQRKPT